MIESKIIADIINKIALGYNPEKIFLFGSYAKGTPSEDSDIDLLIIKETSEPRYKRSVEIQKLLKDSKLPVDIVVYTNDEFENGKRQSLSFINSAIKDSQLLYERK